MGTALLHDDFDPRDFTVTESPDLQEFPGAAEQVQLRRLHETLIRARAILRAGAGSPIGIQINSGFRSPLLNSSLNDSSPTSQHMHGQAADIRPLGLSAGEAFDLLRPRAAELGIRQLIWYADENFLHVGVLGPGYATRKPWAQIKRGADHWEHVPWEAAASPFGVAPREPGRVA